MMRQAILSIDLNNILGSFRSLFVQAHVISACMPLLIYSTITLPLCFNKVELTQRPRFAVDSLNDAYPFSTITSIKHITLSVLLGNSLSLAECYKLPTSSFLLPSYAKCFG